MECGDEIAQEYLMDVLVQVFPDEFHLDCLDLYLRCICELERGVNVFLVFSGLVTRICNYVRNCATITPAKDCSIEDDDEVPIGIRSVSLMKKSKTIIMSTINETDGGIEMELFDIFWKYVLLLMEKRLDYGVDEFVDLMTVLCEFCISVYPNRTDYVDLLLGLATKTYRDRKILVLDGYLVSDLVKLSRLGIQKSSWP